MENNMRPLNEKELSVILETLLPLLATLNAEGYCLGEIEKEDGSFTHVFSAIKDVTKNGAGPTPVLPLSEALEMVQNFSYEKSYNHLAFNHLGNMIVRLLLSVDGLYEDIHKKLEEVRTVKNDMIN